MPDEWRVVLHSLKVPQLKEVCKSYAAPYSGLKKELQERLERIVVEAVNSGNILKVNDFILRCRQAGQMGSAHTSPAATPVRIRAVYSDTPMKASPGSMTMASLASIPKNSAASASYSGGMPNFSNTKFKPSPFYEPLESLGTPKVFEVRLGSGFAEFHFELSSSQYARIHPENLQVLFFVTTQNEALAGPASIIYPTKTSLHIGGMEVPRKYLGLKGKPWTAAPADITMYTKKGKKSTLQMKFDTPNEKYDGVKRYVMFAFLSKRIRTPEIIEKIKKTKLMSKEEVLKMRKSSEADDDIEATSEEVSLKDKATLCRITTPARSTTCHHVQCFDLEVFFSMMENYPTYECTACNRVIPWESIIVDGYFAEILAKAPEDVEKVEIQPDGTWSLPEWKKEDTVKEEKDAKTKKEELPGDGDEDVICLSDDDDAAPAAGPSKSNKAATPARKAASPEVIDLTSDSEEPPPPPRSAPRRHSGTNGVNGTSKNPSDSVKVERANSRRESTGPNGWASPVIANTAAWSTPMAAAAQPAWQSPPSRSEPNAMEWERMRTPDNTSHHDIDQYTYTPPSNNNPWGASAMPSYHNGSSGGSGGGEFGDFTSYRDASFGRMRHQTDWDFGDARAWSAGGANVNGSERSGRGWSGGNGGQEDGGGYDGGGGSGSRKRGFDELMDASEWRDERSTRARGR
ncbi:SUMO ligase siz1 [Rhizophlyctis rosea]|uniref:SUMO ligase siz1 n=1 Tax=Rhizophlyctis rosea TaxID=64517 RepID=A0AAD5S789_9FUNG|nr:SUMO ligase siz1 [Rhizophlyctis rosea]